jgi:hypothetical protein
MKLIETWLIELAGKVTTWVVRTLALLNTLALIANPDAAGSWYE